jgi:hypothetical protein
LKSQLQACTFPTHVAHAAVFNSVPLQEADVTHFKLQLKVACSLGSNDTIALQAHAFLQESDGGNETISVRARGRTCTELAGLPEAW